MASAFYDAAISVGALIMHPSKLLHRGATVTSGTRYVLVGFVSVGEDPLWALTPDPSKA